MRIENRLAAIRKSRALGAADLARLVGTTRQTIYAIEAGTFVPNTEVALQLARHLAVSVEELFSLPADPARQVETLSAELLTSPASADSTLANAASFAPGHPVRICPLPGSSPSAGNPPLQWVAVPVSATPYYMPEADGVIHDQRLPKPSKSARKSTATDPAFACSAAELLVFSKPDPSPKRLLLAGCDPATGLLSSMVEKVSGVEVVSAGAASQLALRWLVEGKVHIAGSHLEDQPSGEFNLPFLRQHYPQEDFQVVTFARWEEGFVVAPGNPKHLRHVDDLARPEIRFVNREPGSGSRALLDRLLAQARVPARRVNGYTRVAYGHLAAAYAVQTGAADVCLATRSAAQTFQLHFVPLHQARYDLVLRRRTAELPSVQAFLDVLQRAALRRKLELLAGYDTTQTGAILQ